MLLNDLKPQVIPTTLNNDAIVDFTLDFSDEFRELIKVDGKPISKDKANRRERVLNLDNESPLKMAPLMYEFVFALTPLALMKNSMKEFFLWKDPIKTLLISVVFTGLILSRQSKTVIGAALVIFTIFSKKIIPLIISFKPLKDDADKSMEVYKRNSVLMRVKISILPLNNFAIGAHAAYDLRG